VEDLYKTLGVARDASQAAIRKAYRSLAKQLHPDLNPGNAKAEERFKTVASANEILSDPAQRARYDSGEIDSAGAERPQHPGYRDFAEGAPGQRYGAAGGRAGGWRGGDFDDIFGSMFGDAGRDVHYRATVSFLDAVNGGVQRLTLPDGRSIDLSIPAGTADGQVLRLRGQGQSGGKGGAGDALVDIAVAPHRFFRRDGATIRLDLPVSLQECALGGAVMVPTPGGAVQLTIPPHSENGQRLRLKGRGVPAHAGQPAGDLYARLQLVLGPADPALDAFLQSWTPAQTPHPRHDLETVP
jgi:DnaJ-class molecular chaperone